MKRFELALLAGLTLAAAQPALAVVTCEPFGTVNVNSGGTKTFVVQNNRWNTAATGQQCIDVNTSTGAFTVTQADGSVPTNGAPKSYPSIFKGCHWGNCTNNSGMPIQVSNIGSATSSWNVTLAGGTWNAAYDIWFNTTPSTSGAPDGLELMIWIASQGSIQPIGSQVGTVNIGGATWQVWVGNAGWRVISFRRTSNATSVSLDIRPFINEAIARGQLQSNWYLIAAEAGFEPWSGGAGLRTNSFSFNVSSGPNPQPTPTPTPTPGPTPTPTPPPSGGATCSNPTTVSMPITRDGAATLCLFTTGNIAFVNSWNTQTVEINGVNFTNRWSNSLPARVNGGYYIRYVANVAWAHFEAR
jgi:hypothetical protein